MTGCMPRCPTCGDDLVLEMDPEPPPGTQTMVLSADPPFHFVCVSPACQSGRSDQVPEQDRAGPVEGAQRAR